MTYDVLLLATHVHSGLLLRGEWHLVTHVINNTWIHHRLCDNYDTVTEKEWGHWIALCDCGIPITRHRAQNGIIKLAI